MSTHFVRIIGILGIAFALAIPTAFAASQDKKAAQRAEVEAGKACGAECGKKHGTGTKKDEQSDRGAYENCMNTCIKEHQAANMKPRKN